MRKLVTFGDVLLVSLPSHAPKGHEQEGPRPAIVVGIPDRLDMPRYPIVLVVPLTTQEGTWAKKSPRLYPCLEAGVAGLPKRSIALLDQVRGLDARRVLSYLGSLAEVEMTPLLDRLQQMLGPGS